MSIVNYPNRIYSGNSTAIDREMAQRKPITVRGRQNINAQALDVVVSANNNWQLDSVSLVFNNVTARNYAVGVLGGKKVVTNRNDYLWFATRSGSGYSAPQMITLDAGFYTGAQLATELKTQMDANAVFAAHGLVFTVTYTHANGLFRITPSSGTIEYFNINPKQDFRTRDSIAGHLFGLTVDTGLLVSVVTDTPQYGLASEASIINETAAIVLQHYHDDLHSLYIDQAIHLSSNSGVNVFIDYTVVYEELV